MQSINNHSTGPTETLVVRILMTTLSLEARDNEAVERQVGVLEHLGHVRQAGVDRREWGHHLAIVVLDLAGKEGHGTLHRGGGDEATDANHGGAAVVDLDEKATLLLLRGLVLGEAEGVKEVEERVAEVLTEGVEGWVEARLATLHVVLLASGGEGVGALAPDLKEEDEAEDLQLRRGGERIPLRGGRAGSGDVGVGEAGQGGSPREVDAVLLHNEADEGSHSNAAVLDLRVTQVADGSLLVEAIHGVDRLAEAEGVVVAKNGVELGSHGLEVLKGLHDGSDGAGHRGRLHSRHGG